MDSCGDSSSSLRWSSVTGRLPRSWALGLPRHSGRRHRRPARLHPHVVLYFDGTEPRDASVKLVQRAFRSAVGGGPQDVAVTIKTPEGDPAAVLTGIARTGDLIVVGRGEPGLERVLHGSVSRVLPQPCRVPGRGRARPVVPFLRDRHGRALPWAPRNHLIMNGITHV
jgi:nucleotide-binding universal stress UspA family protein